MNQAYQIEVGNRLREDFMLPNNISPYRLAKDTGVPLTRIYDILHGRRTLSIDTALRLAKYFGTSEDCFIHMQAVVSKAACKSQIQDELDLIKPFCRKQDLV